MKLYFVTTNQHKVEEARAILGAEVEQLDFDYPEIRALGTEEIAADGARLSFEKFGKPLFVEDAGLFVDKLDRFPGTYSAYVFKTLGCEGILKLLEGVEEAEGRGARFISTIAYLEADSEVRVFTGIVSGGISHEMRGSGGFGYDPIFVPEGQDQTFAELGDEKNQISHRYLALKKFGDYLNDRDQD